MKNLLLTLLLVCASALSCGELYAQAEPTKPELKSNPGGMWQFYPPKEVIPGAKSVLLIGDSVLSGYCPYVIESIGEQVNVYYWLTPMHLKSETILEDLKSVVSFVDYDVIHFNIGLHGWQADRMTAQAYPEAITDYVKTLKKGAKKSTLIWATTTPVTEEGVMILNEAINPVIINKNESADKVMKHYKITINDLYDLMVNRINLAKLDRFHWEEEGSRLMADQVVEYITKALDSQR